jgi:hypothetical protein
VRRRWLNLCIVWPSHLQISTLSRTILSLGKTRSRREPNLCCRDADWLGWFDVVPKRSLNGSCGKGRHIDADSLICSLSHCECDGHTVHKLSQRRITADWLVPRESDCSRTRCKFSSDCLSGYIKVAIPVPEIFKITEYFPDWPLMSHSLRWHGNWAEFEVIWNVDACCREHGHKLPKFVNVLNIIVKWMTFSFASVSMIHWICYFGLLANTADRQ